MLVILQETIGSPLREEKAKSTGVCFPSWCELRQGSSWLSVVLAPAQQHWSMSFLYKGAQVQG